jgi:hypothetical protein
MSLSDYVHRIRRVAETARSEAKLEGEMNHLLKECLSEFGIQFDPHVNETLRSLGLSQVDADRPDGVFGHIVYDYKAPGKLSNPADLQEAKDQIEKRYLDKITGGHDASPAACSNWFGYLCDGVSLAYCRSNRRAWQWSRLLPLNESTLLFLVHAFRALRRKPLTAKLLSDAFGKNADVARETIRVMCSHLAKPRHKTNMLFREWKRLFQQVSTYALDQLPSLRSWALENGIATKDASHILFAMHTYYSLVVKILTSELLSISAHSSVSVCEEMIAATTIDGLCAVMATIEDSEHYKRYRISNFLEGDFFGWYLNERSRPLADAIRAVAREFLEFEPASAILLPEAKQDLLKEFYSSLVDEQIRHDLGEYYTPDWLAQHLLDCAGYDGDPGTRLLDPSCGSGTFLVESIARLKNKCENAEIPPRDTLETILSNVKGIDLNPLAVISARANYILSIYDLVFDLGQDIELPVYLADAINVPQLKKDLAGSEYLEYTLDTEVERYVLEIPWEFVKSQVLGKVLLGCENAVKHSRDFGALLQTMRADAEIAPNLSESVVARLEEFFEVIQSLEGKDWDRIWCRILKNTFSPRGFAQFDYIIGNPPWVRWSRLPEAYRAKIKAFCDYYGLVSGRGYSGGIESDISTVITFSAADRWLAEGGIVALLITWTVFKSGSARGFRIGRLPGDFGLRVERIEDLTRLQPFADAANETSVYIATKVRPASLARFKSTNCHVWRPQRGKSRIPAASSLARVYELCHIDDGAACPVGDWGTPLFTGDLANYHASSYLRGESPYLESARRGTISDCARVYWLKVLKYSESNGRALVRTLTEKELPRARQIDPVHGAWIEADLLYPMVRGRDVGRFAAASEGWYQLIPNNHYENVDDEDTFADKYPLTYSYLKNYEGILGDRSTHRRYQSHLPFYVIYCVGTYSFSPYKVVWLEQQDPKTFRASVVSAQRRSLIPNAVIIPDHKLYFADFAEPAEAHYVCGFLNSLPARTWLGGFLHGKQIGTTVFEFMNVPRFDPTNSNCLAIADISRKAHAQREGTRNIALLSNDLEDRLSQHVRVRCGG